MPIISVLKGDGGLKEEVGTVIFKRVPVETEQDVVRRGLQFALGDLQNIADRIAANEVVGQVGEYEWRLEAPRVFISYSWTSEEHADWVVALAKRLTEDGVEVVLDKWDLKAGHDKHDYMEKMVKDPAIERVLVICDQLYADKADDRKGGVGTETLIISPEVYRNAAQEKFLPIIRERNADGKECVPTFLDGRIYFDFSGDSLFDSSYDQLLRNIFKKPELERPPLGKMPSYLKSASPAAPAPRITGPLSRLTYAAQNDKPNKEAALQDYFDSFIEGLEDFRLTFTAGDKEADDKIVESIVRFRPYRDSFVDVMALITSYMDDDKSYASVISFFERLAPFGNTPTWVHHSTNVSCDNYLYFQYEMVLYAIAYLIKRQKYGAAAMLMTSKYVYENRPGEAHFVDGSISIFNDYPRGLEEIRKHRLKLNQVSVVGSLVKEGATNPQVSFRALCQADFVLYLSGFFPNGGGSGSWYPRCASCIEGTLELFAKAPTPYGQKAILQLLRVASLQAFLERIAQAEKDFVQAFTGYSFRFSVGRAINLEGIKRAAFP